MAIGEVRVAATALTFLTRLPLARLSSADPAGLSAATRWFPVVGLSIGGLLAMTLLGVDALVPTTVAVVLTIAVGVLVTGGLHEDGFADVADSAGAFGVERRLAIMRDSRIGAYGALALLLLVLARFVTLSAIAASTVSLVVAALVTAHVMARWSSVALMAALPYARPEGANGIVAQGVKASQLGLATAVAALCLIPAAALAPLMTMMAIIAALIIASVAGWWFKRTLGGITGDCLGAANVLVEIVVLAVATGFVA
ncbi:MAG: adenosylcobinamide-GDP ribazoletransferase [Ornithinimicrobium sp.]